MLLNLTMKINVPRSHGRTIPCLSATQQCFMNPGLGKNRLSHWFNDLVEYCVFVMGGGGGDIIVLSMSHTTNQCNNVKNKVNILYWRVLLLGLSKKKSTAKTLNSNFVCAIKEITNIIWILIQNLNLVFQLFWQPTCYIAAYKWKRKYTIWSSSVSDKLKMLF